MVADIDGKRRAPMMVSARRDVESTMFCCLAGSAGGRAGSGLGGGAGLA